MTSPIPAELKPAAGFLSRAREIQAHDPVIAYWCNYHAAQIAMALRPASTESRTFLFTLLDQLEEAKSQLADNQAVTEEIAGGAYIENFAVKVFAQADNADRAGKATKATAKSFLAAANFYELLADFGETDPEIKDKIKYAKWKATDIVKAIKEGREPVPGPAGGVEEPELPSAPANEDVVPSSPRLSATTEDEEREVEQLLRGLTPSTDAIDPSSQPASQDESNGQQDVADALGPPSPSYPFPSTDTTSMSDPSASTFDASQPSQPLPPPAHSVDDAFSTAVLPSAPAIHPDSFPAYSPLPPNAPIPPAPIIRQPSTVATPLPSTPQAVPSRTQPHSQPATEQMYDFKAISNAQKYAKFAISALNFDDVVEARKQLRKALEVIGG